MFLTKLANILNFICQICNFFLYSHSRVLLVRVWVSRPRVIPREQSARGNLAVRRTRNRHIECCVVYPKLDVPPLSLSGFCSSSTTGERREL